MRITECILIIGIQVGRNILGPHITFLQVIVFGTQFDNLPFVSAIRNRYAALRLSLVRIAEREVAPYVQFVFQKRSSKAGRILQHLVIGIDTVLAIDKVTDRISGRESQAAVGVEDRRGRMALIGNITPDGAAFADVDRVMVIHIGKIHIVLDLQPVEHLYGTFRTQVHHLIIVGIIAEQTVVAIEPSGNVVVQFPVVTGHRQVMVLCESRFLVQGVIIILVAVIDIFTGSIDRHLVSYALLLPSFEVFQPAEGEFLRLVDVLRVGRIVVPRMIGFIEMTGIFISVGHEVGNRHRFLHGEISGIGNGSLVLSRLFGGDQYDPESTARPIDGSRSGIFQDRHASDIVRVQHRGITFHTVDQDQCATTLPDRSRTADIITRRTGRLAVSQLDVQVGDRTLQGLCHVGNGTIVKHFAGHLFDSSGQVHFLLRAVTDHDHFVQLLHIFHQDHFQLFLSFQCDFFRDISDKRDG